MYSSDKHKAFSAKVEIIKKLDKGEKLINLAKAYGVRHATIYDIRKNREKIEYNLIILF
jgi:Mor family transcriptional regulator